MKKRFFTTVALLLVASMGVFLLSSCFFKNDQSSEKGHSNDQEIQEEPCDENDPNQFIPEPDPLWDDENTPVSDPDPDPVDEGSPDEPSQTDPLPSTPTDESQNGDSGNDLNGNSDIVVDPALIDPNVDWESGWQTVP